MSENETNSGIYSIRNRINEKFYVGSSINFHNREREHFWMLENNNHFNQHLQYSYNKHGWENFYFQIEEKIENLEDLIPREQVWLDEYFGNLAYNICPIAGSMLGYRHTEETKKLMSELQRGENNPNWNKVRPKEHCEKISRSRRGKSVGKDNPNWNKIANNAKKVKQIDIITGELINIWDSLTLGAKAVGLKRHSGIWNVCNGRRKSAGGFFWEYL